MAKNEFVVGRNITVRTINGITVRFRSGEPTYVPPQAHEAVIGIGARPVDGEIDLPDKEDVLVLPKAPAGTERDSQIKDVIRAMVARNDREDFTGANKPDARKITKILKYRVESTERDRLWDEIVHENDTEE